jgi:hypothetical protein
MAVPDPAWRPENYPASVPPRRLAQVWYAGRLIFVNEAALDAGEVWLAVYTGTGRYTRRHVMAGHINASETVTLADGAADQSLIPGVAPVPLTARQIAQERQRREARRGAAGLPCGGLWDETAINQGSLF